MQMPRGAIPVSRSELAASDPYRPDAGEKIFLPSGDFPSSNQELAAAPPYKPAGAAPESFLAWPQETAQWWSGPAVPSSCTEEAFAKACATPGVLLPVDVVLLAEQQCGSSNFAEFLQTQGFPLDGKTYLDGPFYSVDWTNAAALQGAIAHAGPVKIGIASANLASSGQGQGTPGASGWVIWGLPKDLSEDRFASLCGYGIQSALVELFERHGVVVHVPPEMPAGLCYAMFTGGSIGIIDSQSLLNITGEAWVRNPTTITRKISG